MRISLTAACVCTTFVLGCMPVVYPVTDGFNTMLLEPRTRVVVWGNHSGSVGKTTVLIQRFGLKVVERAKLQEILNEQKIDLASVEEAHLLRIGSLIGAQLIVFVDVQVTSSEQARVFANAYYAGGRTDTVYNTSVSVRAVDVHSSEIILSGTAHYPRPINNPEAAILYLTEAALSRAACPAGYWRERSRLCDWTGFTGKGVIGIEVVAQDRDGVNRLVITQLMPDSPAEKSGLLVGDIILSCNERTGFHTYWEFKRSCKLQPGTTVTLEVLRGEQHHAVKVKVIEPQIR